MAGQWAVLYLSTGATSDAFRFVTAAKDARVLGFLLAALFFCPSFLHLKAI